MNEQSLEQADWSNAVEEGHTLAMVIELGMLPEASRLQLFTEQSVSPLLQQPEVADLRHTGPALVDLSGQSYRNYLALRERLDPVAQHGWLSSRINIIELQQHLGDALACRDLDGEPLLIRSYAHNVLPVLHARTDLAWHSWLFGPVVAWWVPTAQGWQRLQGLALNKEVDYQPIELDQSLAKELSVDPHAQALLAELESQAPDALVNGCYSERLTQVSEALAQARQAGLTRQQDQYFYALYSLLGGQPINQNPNWLAMLQQVEGEGQALVDVQLALDEQA
ncbi:DUF4123 domain-containing protein [Pseudomonas sp. 5P_3.1_Bac2]|uniref:DUF4123 domain-containing protein n=1 Tax=Pseudomonas sp. 5P_3.1_Bac2 TaxID=2971617 RepID=UPI0021C58745|nr:DUF4123 domain-containing protein [Pseudomonas sp. 5P_3.1_Bac2]MCU1718608.1 DUF4123 domain-containing protein [Pseudomonas sp. 5P_3.1_Bac2]